LVEPSDTPDLVVCLAITVDIENERHNFFRVASDDLASFAADRNQPPRTREGAEILQAETMEWSREARSNVAFVERRAGCQLCRKSVGSHCRLEESLLQDAH